MLGAGVAPPAACVSAVGESTRGASPLPMASLADGTVGWLDRAVAVSTNRGRGRQVWFLIWGEVDLSDRGGRGCGCVSGGLCRGGVGVLTDWDISSFLANEGW